MSNYNAKIEVRVAQKDYYEVCPSEWAHDRSIYQNEEYAEMTLYPAYLSNETIKTIKMHMECAKNELL